MVILTRGVAVLLLSQLFFWFYTIELSLHYIRIGEWYCAAGLKWLEFGTNLSIIL